MRRLISSIVVAGITLWMPTLGAAQTPQSFEVAAPERPLALPSSWRPSDRYPWAAPRRTDTQAALGRAPKAVTDRPRWTTVPRYAGAFGPPTRVWSYRPYYSRWGQHPYRRFRYATTPSAAQSEEGFREIRGPDGRALREPTFPPPPGYVWEAGYWSGDDYIEGFFRIRVREDGAWDWVAARQRRGRRVGGYWRPEQVVEGYSWEPGFFDGVDWVAGFWRPMERPDFVWVPARRDGSVLETGYWRPERDRAGSVWIPGWFDGSQWVPGLWVDEASYDEAEAIGWQPLDAPASAPPRTEERPLAVPVESP